LIRATDHREFRVSVPTHGNESGRNTRDAFSFFYPSDPPLLIPHLQLPLLIGLRLEIYDDDDDLCVQLNLISWTADRLPRKVCRSSGSTVLTPACADLCCRYPQRCRWSMHVLISNRGPPPSYAFVTRIYRGNLRSIVMASPYLAAVVHAPFSDSRCG